jgi:long-chain acyl-CoA synthetase
LGEGAIKFISTHSEVTGVVASADKLLNILRVADQCPNLKMLVCMDGAFQEQSEYARAWCSQLGIEFYTWPDLIQYGKEHLASHVPPSPQSECTICYTSGTTGDPKGVILTHGNMSAAANKSLVVFNYFGLMMCTFLTCRWLMCLNEGFSWLCFVMGLLQDSFRGM